MSGSTDTARQPLVAIGALGGSGTRAVARIIAEAGVFLGDELTGKYDNLKFTRLFKNPEFFEAASRAELAERMALFHRLCVARKPGDWWRYLNIGRTNPKRKLVARDLPALARSFLGGAPEDEQPWGWKEPNTHIYLEALKAQFPDIRYVHVIRHGLDMALSANRDQLNTWGYRYDVRLADRESARRVLEAQIRYWSACNHDVLERGQKLFGDRFYVLEHHRLYEQPRVEVDALTGFLGLAPDENVRQTLYDIPKRPGSAERYLDKGAGFFSDTEIAMVEDLGFKVRQP